MQDFLLIELQDGKRVRDPNTNKVLESGRAYRVKKIQFWLKRLEDGDVKLFVEKQEKEPSGKKKKEKAGE